MADPCFRCGAARECEHREYEGPRVVEEPTRPARHHKKFKRSAYH